MGSSCLLQLFSMKDAGKTRGLALFLCVSCVGGALLRTAVSVRVATASPARRIRAANPLDEESDFERYEVLRNILDGGAHAVEVNELIALLLGYSEFTPYVEPERARAWQTEFPTCPDLFADEAGDDAGDESDAFSWLEADIPDDPEQLEAMQVLFETLYGEEAVRLAQKSGDPDFARRSTIVTWIVLTTKYWTDVAMAPSKPL